jgi:transcriptional regulator GlxA family with amidase domain
MTKTIGIIIFPDVEELDFVGPLEALGGMSRLSGGDWRVVTVAESKEPVDCTHGLRALPDHSFGDAPPLDVILIPGGFGTRTEVDNPALMDFVRRSGKSASYVTSVCTGAFILARAGFLDGRRATTHWGSIDRLRELEGVTVVDDERFVHDGNVITAAGVSAGIDMSLYLINLLTNESTALNVQKMMEYYPKPPEFKGAAA